MEVNLNIQTVFVLTKAGKEQYARSYNKDLPEMYQKPFDEVKMYGSSPLWELIYFFGESGISPELLGKAFEGSSFIIRDFENKNKLDTVVNAGTKVRVEWTENGKKVMAAVEGEDVFDGYQGKDASDYPDVMEMPFSKFAYLIRNECFNGNTRMPLTKNNAITFLI